jgi:hypothetical protein
MSAYETFFRALRDALTNSDSVQLRLEKVMCELSSLNLLDRSAFHDDPLWEQFQNLHKQVTTIPGDQGTIRATTSQMNTADASKVLQNVFELFCRIAEIAP